MKRLLPFLALAVIMMACVKLDNPNGICFSVLGDSYSSYIGYVEPETNDIYPYDSIGVTSVEQMWWHRVAVGMGWTLERNNSFSGALISNFDSFGAGDFYRPNSFLNRMDNLGDPDVIFVLGGSNDVWDGAGFGDYVFSDWTEEQLKEIRPAMAYMFEHLGTQYPKAKVYFLIDMDFCPGGIADEIRQTFIDSAHYIANHYNVSCIDLYDVRKTLWHPDNKGQKAIANQVLEVLRADFNV